MRICSFFYIHSQAAYFVFFCKLKNMMTAKNFFHVTGNHNQLNQFSALKRRRKNAARPRTDAQHSTNRSIELSARRFMLKCWFNERNENDLCVIKNRLFIVSSTRTGHLWSQKAEFNVTESWIDRACVNSPADSQFVWRRKVNGHFDSTLHFNFISHTMWHWHTDQKFHHLKDETKTYEKFRWVKCLV